MKSRWEEGVDVDASVPLYLRFLFHAGDFSSVFLLQAYHILGRSTYYNYETQVFIRATNSYQLDVRSHWTHS